MKPFFGIHNHTYYSNIRLLDCINRPKDLIDRAIKLGMSGIAITDHECLSAHMEVNQYAKEIKEKYPDFKIALGNEIYLVEDRTPGQKYYHFILIAKDEIGHKALRELSSIAWYQSYVDRGMERVPTTKEELKRIVEKYPNHLIATTACIGGEVSQFLLLKHNAEIAEDKETAAYAYKKVIDLITFCKGIFGNDFYIECAPGTSREQKIANLELYRLAQDLDIKIVIGCDAHYLKKEDRFVHKAYLNSKGGEREVDSFYEFTYLMDYEEASSLLSESFNNDRTISDAILDNTLEIQKKIKEYSLERKQIIPKVEVTNYNKQTPIPYEWFDKYPVICSLISSDNIQERYWVNECIIALQNKNLYYTPGYLERIEIEADVIKCIGEKLDDCLFAYFNTFKHYIDLFWECGSIVGPGRGSATGFLSNYLLGITQLDPVRWKLPYWRFLNKERAELPDIDIDLAPSKRPKIFEAIRKERGELGLVQVATFGTEGTKSAILTACRGYRGSGAKGEVANTDNSGFHEEGIDVDEAQYMSSLIPQERGFLWPMKDVVYGNPEKDRKPVKEFIREVNKYPGLLDIIMSIEGMVNKRSSHASGVILYGEDPFDTAAFMKTPSGDLITCYDLHMAEAGGDTKYDFLVTEISDKIITCFNLLMKDGVIPEDTLRNTYNKYLHPENLDTTDKRIWRHLAAGDVLDVFQFSTGVGLAIAKKLKPQNPMEMTAANAMMRLMSEKDKESQQDRYYRIQHQGIQVFDQEMRENHLPEDMIELMHHHCDKYFGCCPIQEQMMEILMDAAKFTLGEANSARKIVAKKKMDKIPELKKQVYEKVNNEKVADYLWEVAVAPQLGYAFSLNHSLPYSFVGIQTIYLAINFNPIYWNTACLIVNSGSLEDNSEDEIVDIYEPEGSDLANGTIFIDLPDKKTKIRRTSATDYGKVARAIGNIQEAGIKVSLADINRSDFGFAPDVEHNQILFGLKGMLNVGDDIISDTIKKRPFVSPRDFLNRVKPNKQAMISLIKGGAFDAMMDRKLCMCWYLWETCDKKKRLTLQNMGALIKYSLIPENTPEQIMARRVYEFNRYLKLICKKNGENYFLDDRAINFLIELKHEDLIENTYYLNIKKWDKVYQIWMNVFRNWLNEEKESVLLALNKRIFLEDWNKYAKGTISSWEMEVLCFYYHEHELAHINNNLYGFADFYSLPEDPEIEKTFLRGGKEIHLFKLHRICGTCIAKNKIKSTVTLLTTTGVVEVKFRKEYFSLFDKQISVRGEDGIKHVVEKSWFNRGNMIVVMGIRSGDNFIAKKYNSVAGHQLYRINHILEDGTLTLQDERVKGEESDV